MIVVGIAKPGEGPAERILQSGEGAQRRRRPRSLSAAEMSLTVPLPADLTPGYYNLTITDAEGSGRTSSATIVQVGPRG